MTETVVHVTSLGQWKSVLDVWFEQGYSWYSGGQKYNKGYFNSGARYLFLDEDNDILKSLSNDEEPYIEYSEFIVKQREDNKMKTYYVTQEQLDLIEKLKSDSLPFYNLVKSTTDEMKELAQKIPDELDSKILRYIGGDETIVLKVNEEKLYRLWRIDSEGDKVYMRFDVFGTPDGTMDEDHAFTVPLEEIRKHKTPAWDIEEAD